MLKIGVLGAGHLGKIHLKLLDQSSKYNLIGFYDPDVTNGQRIEKEFDYKYFKQITSYDFLRDNQFLFEDA